MTLIYYDILCDTTILMIIFPKFFCSS